MRTVESFMKGYKPAFLEIPDTKWTTKHLEYLKENYHYVNENDYNLLDGRRFYLFFQNEIVKALFEAEINRSDFSAKEIDRILGTVLGFPTRAVDYYVKMMDEKRKGNLAEFQRMKDRKVGLIYCGLSFSSGIKDLEVNALWLLERYPYGEAREDGMYIRFNGERIPVPIEKPQQIAEFQKEIMRKITVPQPGE